MISICKGCDYSKKAINGICAVRKGIDGFDVRCVGRWAQDKYFYLGRYIDLFSTSMKDKWHGNLYYVDLFSGCGRCRIRTSGEEIDGSALLSLKVKYPFKKYFFIDKNPEALDSLKQRISSLPLAERVDLIQGDCNERVSEILRKIPAQNTLCLTIIDPTGLHIKFDTIKRLTEDRRVDLVITFPEGMAIKRNLERFLAQSHSVLDNFMGGREWRRMFTIDKLIKLKVYERKKRFIELYRQKLKSIGYKETKSSDDILIRSSEKRLPLYYLLFASKHPLGHKFWSIVGEIEPGGQQRLKFNNPYITLIKSPDIKLSKLKIYRKPYKMLDGRRKILIERVNDGSIIKRFDKTPSPRKSTDVVCPHFLELKWAYGCPFDCAWCYLKGTFRFRPEGIKPVIKDLEKIELHTKVFLDEVKTPEILNTGEIADSLMAENRKFAFSKMIIPLFEAQDRHKVLFLTKSNNIKHLLDINPHNQVIVSFSLNALAVAKKWENKAPAVDKRIEAAKKLADLGYEIRIRIDPMVPVKNWEKHYEKLLDLLLANLTPERITFGSLRGLQSTLNSTEEDSWKKYLKESSNWGKKVEFPVRYNMYANLIDYLKSRWNYKKIALCKETLAIWCKLRMDYKKIKCNCIW